MAREAASILLSGFSARDEGEALAMLGGLGRDARAGGPEGDGEAGLVLAAAYDERSLRLSRALAMDDGRPWAFCVPASERPLVAAAAAAREGRLVLLPLAERELRRVLVALDLQASELGAGAALLSAASELRASFAWRSSELEVSATCRALARLLSDAGLFAGQGGADDCELALEEALVNALEHGNLGLDSSLRPDDAALEDRYVAERLRRLADPIFGDRLVKVEIAIDEGKSTIVVEDEGSGFDASSLDEEPSPLGASGKGLWLIRRAFDSVAFGAGGTRLTLTKKRPPARSGADPACPGRDRGGAMNIELNREGEELTIVIDGNIDTEGGPKLAAALQEAMGMKGLRGVSFDLTTVKTITSSGIGKIMNFFKHVEGKNGSMRVRGISEPLYRQFMEIHIDRIFPVQK